MIIILKLSVNKVVINNFKNISDDKKNIIRRISLIKVIYSII